MKRALPALVLAALTAAAPKPHAPAASAAVGTWNVSAAQMDANLTTGQFSVPVPLVMTRSDGSTVQGDRAVGNFKLKRIALYGNVSVHDVSGSFGLQSGQSAQGRGASTLTSDELLVNDRTRLYDARGNVHYEQGDTKVDAQTAHLNDKTHQITLDGNVHIVQGDRLLDADKAVYNTQSGEGVAQNNVRMEFPGVTPQIATPKPITIKAPKIP
ncbi:MAG: LptA/OstA family protein [Candidatus Baltobacteraceae bacterium]